MPFEISDAFKAEMDDDWIHQIGEYNRAIQALIKLKVDSIPVPNQPDARKKEQLDRSYRTLMQAHLRRFLCLIDSIELLWNTGRLLPCTMMGRSCMESAAIAGFINAKLDKYIEKKAYNQAYYWIASHMLLVRTDIEAPGFEDLKLKSLHINDSINSADALVTGYQDAYDWLSEFLHPNSFGVFASFCNYRPDLERATFLDDQEISRKTISNCMTSLISVPVFARAFVEVESLGKRILATDWAGDDNLEKLFQAP